MGGKKERRSLILLALSEVETREAISREEMRLLSSVKPKKQSPSKTELL
jgi:hypothetical protein